MRTFFVASGIGIICVALVCQQSTSVVPQVQAATVQSTSDDEPKVTPEKSMSFWMDKKLEYSKSILESLTKGNFEQLAIDAEHMRRLGKIEGFVRRKSKDYKTQLHSFDLANLELVRQAERKNAEGATLAFNQLTTSCVACHMLMREGVE